MSRTRWNLIWLQQCMRLLIVALVDLAARTMLHICTAFSPDVRPNEAMQYVLDIFAKT